LIGVFGANGFIGKHVVRGLAGDGADVVAVARRFDDDVRVLPVRVATGDLRDSDAMSKALVGVETVIQLMASSTPAQGNARTAEDIQHNVIPHVEFLNLCADMGVQRFVFASSGGTVYGPVDPDFPVPETAATHPICSHGVTKLMVEQFIRLHAHLDGLDFAVLRVANPYGPGQVFRNGQGLIPALLGRHAAGLPVRVFGDGSAARDYVYIDDVVSAVRAATYAEGPLRQVFNIGTGVPRSVAEVIAAIEEVAGITFDIEHVPARASDVPAIALDASLALCQLGWTPTVDFHEGLARTIPTLLGGFSN